MASSIIHLAITNELMKHIKFENEERLKLGAILPDAADNSYKSHFKVLICGNCKKTYDLEEYRTRFGKQMREDNLYLGYYLHLLQDILFRGFVYNGYKWNPLIPGNIERLHRDYAISNYYVICKYGLDSNFIIPENINQQINNLGKFDAVSLVNNVKESFEPVDYNDTFFFTTDMADEYIKRATKFCLEELKKIEVSETGIDSYEWAWDNWPKSILETTFNTRDLGGYRSNVKTIFTKYNRIIRSDIQNYPSYRDIEFLKQQNITTVVDMRGVKDVGKTPSGFATAEGFEYYNIPIDEGSGIPESTDCVASSYMEIATAQNIKYVFKTIAKAKDGVIINCTAGKDRTGVVSALLLLLCGVSHEDIIYDYMITKICYKERFEIIHKNFPDVDMNIVIPNEKYMMGFLKLFLQRYNNLCEYLLSLDVTEDEIQKKK